ncbi:MAG: immunoglobulin-like domain-containing protein [Minisyncoccia bacterium]
MKNFLRGGALTSKVFVTAVALVVGGFFAPSAQATVSNVVVTAPNGGEYWRGIQNITWTANGAGSDVVYVTYSPNSYLGTSHEIAADVPYIQGTLFWNTSSVIEGDGSAYMVRLQNGVGTEYDTSNAAFTVDNTKPVTSITIPAPTGLDSWYTAPPTISLTCSDGTGSGCFKTYYRWDSDPYVEYLGTITAPEGVHVLSWYSDDQATDASGVRNEETVQTQTIKVDTAAPTVAVTSTTFPGAYNAGDAINVTLTFSEPVSSTGTLTVALNSGGSCSVPILTNATTGTCTYTVLAVENSAGLVATSITPSAGVVEDIAGNDSTLLPISNIPTAPFPIVIDTTAPSAFTTGAVSTSGGTVVATWWNSTNTGVNIEVPFANDPSLVGGTMQLQAEADGTFENVGSANEIFGGLGGYLGNTISFPITAAELEAISGFSEGDLITFTAIITDLAGNAAIGTQSATVLTVDQIAPAVDAGTDKEVNAVVLQDAIASDTGGSGLNTHAWTQFSGPGALTFGTPVVVDTTISANTNGTYIARLTVTDVAGNSASDDVTFVWDTISPVLAVVTAVTNPTNDTTPDFTFSSTEAGSITYGGDCSSGTTTASSGNNTVTFNVLADGVHNNCTIVVTDVATNASLTLAVPSFEVDTAVATVFSITTTDANLDGMVDTATIVFTDEVKDSTFNFANFTIGGIPATTFTSGAPDDDTVVLSHAGVAGTNAKVVAYIPGITPSTDLAGNILAAFSAASTDAAKPVLLSARTISTTQVTATFSENLNGTTVNGSGDEFTVAGYAVSAASELNGVVTLTVATMPTDAIPLVTYTQVDSLRDLAPVWNTAVTPVSVTAVDGVAPTLSAVSISSNNDGDTFAPEWAKVGDTVKVFFASSEAIATPTVTIDGNTASYDSNVGNNWAFIRVMTASDTEGVVPFSINFSDLSSPTPNAGTQVTAVTDASSVFYDRTNPSVNAGSDKEVNALVLQDATVTDPAPNSGIVTYAWTQTSGPGTITFGTPAAEDTTLSASADGTYVATLTVTDAAGNVGSDTMTFIWDTVAPELLTHSPIYNATGVLVGASTATVTFNEDIVLVNASKVLLVNNSTSASYKGTVVVNGGDGNSAVLNIPYNGLDSGTTYRINVFGSAVRDVAGNVASQTVLTSFFTTEADTVVPVINSLSAGNITTTGAMLSATTNESATCKYSATDSAYTSMTAMSTTGGITHSQALAGLTASTPYTYFVRCQDISGNTMTTSGVASFTTVTAVDTTPPVITLLGMNPVTLTVDDTYIEYGATANDNIDGDITSDIVIDSSAVDTEVAGVYVVTYDVSDSVPNTAVQATRTVIVVDPAVTPITPTVTLNGAAIVSAYTVSEATARFASGFHFDTTNAVSVTVNGSSVPLAATITAATQAQAITLGAHTYNVIVTSSTGNTANITVSYQVNADPVVQGNGELVVTGTGATNSYATADDTFNNGFKWVFHVTVPTTETQFSMKFSDFVSGANSIPAANNIRFYSAQSSDASASTSAMMITAFNTYSSPITLATDLDSSVAGRQIDVTVEMKVPTGTAGGSYSASYGVQSL